MKANKKALPQQHVWRQDFSPGLTCTATFEGGRFLCQWSKPRPLADRAFMAAYVHWMGHVATQVATITGGLVLQIIQISPGEFALVVGVPGPDAVIAPREFIGAV